MSSDALEEKISRIFSREIQRISDEIAWVDRRLYEIRGDSSDEAQVERILLQALRAHLVRDLRELGGFSGDPYLFMGVEERAPGAEARNEAYSYS